MVMGKRRRETQQALFIATDRPPRAAGHPFYEKLNELLDEAGFGTWIEDRCRSYYAADGSAGRPCLAGDRTMLLRIVEVQVHLVIQRRTLAGP
jgi:transposase